MAQPLTAGAVRASVDRLRERLRRQHIALAEKSLRAVEATQGPSPTVIVVDDSRGRTAWNVKPGGKIVYLFDAVPRAVRDVMPDEESGLQYLDTHSPIDTGRFVKSFATLIAGVEGDIAAMKPGDTVTIVNRQPYSRKLELGFSLQAPDGVFEVTAKWLRSRWGKAVDVRFTYVALENLPAVKKPKYRGDSTRYPAIVLTSKVI